MGAAKKMPAIETEIISYNPATNEEVGRVKNFSAEEVNAAVEAAREAAKDLANYAVW